ncbi:MAG: hypothetical protein ABIP94_06510 [Planctomycetota bacterium]
MQTKELRPPGSVWFSPPLALAEDGTFFADGLAAGDWEMTLCYSLVCQEEPPDQPLTRTVLVEVVLPVVHALAEHEQRIVDIDVSGWGSGRLDASVWREGVLVRTGAVYIRPIAANGAPIPILRTSPDLRFSEHGRLAAVLPPARYFATCTYSAGSTLPLGEFDIRSGETTHVDFSVDVVAARVRIVDADGSTPGAGSLELARDGWMGRAPVDEMGLATVSVVLRGDTLRAAFRRVIGTNADGKPLYGSAIALGTLRVADDNAEPYVLRLPQR